MNQDKRKPLNLESAGVYCRVSTKGQNCETQLVAIKEFCVRQGINIFKVYQDIGVSGSKDSRPALNDMLFNLRKNQFKVVVVFRLDRLGRSLQHLLALLQEFRNKNVRLVSVTDGIDTSDDNPMTRAFWQILAVFAEMEKAIIQERVCAGLARARSEGKRLGRPPGAKDKGGKRSISGYLQRYIGKSKEDRKLGKRTKEVLNG